MKQYKKPTNCPFKDPGDVRAWNSHGFFSPSQPIEIRPNQETATPEADLMSMSSASSSQGSPLSNSPLRSPSATPTLPEPQPEEDTFQEAWAQASLEIQRIFSQPWLNSDEANEAQWMQVKKFMAPTPTKL